MAREQDPTAADIAYAQYLAAAEKTRTVGGRVYHRIICKTPLPAPAGGVELILPRAMFRGARAGCVEDERGRVFRLADPVTLHVPGASRRGMRSRLCSWCTAAQRTASARFCARCKRQAHTAVDLCRAAGFTSGGKWRILLLSRAARCRASAGARRKRRLSHA